MKNCTLLLLLFSGICFAQQDKKTDTISDSILKSYQDKQNSAKLPDLLVHDDDIKVTRKYTYQNGEYELKSVTPDIDQRLYREKNMPVNSNSDALSLGGAFFIGLFNTIFK